MVKNTKFGVLYIVATPIGNLEDISIRALKIIQEVTLCAAENTKNSKKLFDHYNINTKLTSYHKFSERNKLKFFISQLQSGNDIALISDAGTPLISDPGFLLVNKALELGFKVIPIPGPSSLTASISVSGLPLDKFVFYGFPPRQKKARHTFVKELLLDDRTSIVFESKSRIQILLEVLVDERPDRDIFLAREMTKLYETFYKGKASEVLERLTKDKNALKGEFVLIIKGKKKSDSRNILNTEQKQVLEILINSLKKKDALSLASKVFKIKRNSLYRLILEDK